jgi:hypothetical protein
MKELWGPGREMFPIMRWERFGRGRVDQMSEREKRDWIVFMVTIGFVVLIFVAYMGWCA